MPQPLRLAVQRTIFHLLDEPVPLCGVASWVLLPGVMLIGINAVILAL